MGRLRLAVGQLPLPRDDREQAVAPRAECANPTASQLDACIDDAWDALYTDVSVGARSYFADYVTRTPRRSRVLEGAS